MYEIIRLANLCAVPATASEYEVILIAVTESDPEDAGSGGGGAEGSLVCPLARRD